MTVVRLIDHAPVACSDQAELFEWLRDWAEALESGKYGEFRSMILVLESKDGRQAMISQGIHQIDNARLAGLLTSCIHRRLDGGASINEFREDS